MGAFAAPACRRDEPAPLPEWDFFGVVARVAFEEPLVEADARHRGGPDSEFAAQAMTITFEDGRVVDVPGGTPGGNWCRDLSVRRARNEECVLAGQFDETGDVAWFQVLDVVDTPRTSGGCHVEVWPPERFEGGTLTVRGVPFTVRGDATIQCHDDASTLPEALASGLGLVAEVSIADATVINVRCVYRA